MAAAGLVGRQRPGAAAKNAAGRKIRSAHDLDNAFEFGLGMADKLDGRVDDLAQVVRRNICRHADRNAVRAVDQQMRRRRRQILGLFRGVVVVRPKIDRAHVDVFEQRLAVGSQTRFGVAHRRRRVAVDRAEVALAVHQRIAHGKILRHAHEGVVDRRIPVGVELAHHLTDNPGRLARRAVGTQSLFPHAVQNAALHGLQAVAHVGQRAAHDDRHRIVEIRFAHLVLDVDRDDVGAVGAAAVEGQSGVVGEFFGHDSGRENSLF